MKTKKLRLFFSSLNKLKFIIILLLFISSLSSFAATKVWNGSESSNWNDGQNWDGGNVPRSRDNVLIPLVSSFYPILSTANDISIKGLVINSDANLTINGGTLEVSKSLENYGALIQTGGTLLVDKLLLLDGGTFTQDIGVSFVKDLKIINGGVYNQLSGVLNINHDFIVPTGNTFTSTGGIVHFTGSAGRGADYRGAVEFHHIVIDEWVDPKFDNDGEAEIFVSGNYTNDNQNLDVTIATFTFNGTEPQSIYSASSYSNSTFGNLTISNSTQVYMLSDLEIETLLTNDLGSLSQNGFDLYVGGIPNPVELTSFTASIFKSGIILNWATATEVNNYGFDVERASFPKEGNSAVRTEWKSIKFIEGHGNSYSPKEYSFYDNSPLIGKAVYRLKQIDTDGVFEYSDEVEITFLESNKIELYQNHPNPFNPSTVISFSIPELSHVNITIYNAIGQKVMELANEQMDAGSHNVNFDGSALASGFYFYSLQTPSFSKTMKMILIK